METKQITIHDLDELFNTIRQTNPVNARDIIHGLNSLASRVICKVLANPNDLVNLISYISPENCDLVTHMFDIVDERCRSEGCPHMTNVHTKLSKDFTLTFDRPTNRVDLTCQDDKLGVSNFILVEYTNEFGGIKPVDINIDSCIICLSEDKINVSSDEFYQQKLSDMLAVCSKPTEPYGLGPQVTDLLQTPSYQLYRYFKPIGYCNIEAVELSYKCSETNRKTNDTLTVQQSYTLSPKQIIVRKQFELNAHAEN